MASGNRTTRHSSSKLRQDQVPQGEEPFRPWSVLFLAAYLGGHRSRQRLVRRIRQESALFWNLETGVQTCPRIVRGMALYFPSICPGIQAQTAPRIPCLADYPYQTASLSRQKEVGIRAKHLATQEWLRAALNREIAYYLP